MIMIDVLMPKHIDLLYQCSVNEKKTKVLNTICIKKEKGENQLSIQAPASTL